MEQTELERLLAESRKKADGLVNYNSGYHMWNAGYKHAIAEITEAVEKAKPNPFPAAMALVKMDRNGYNLHSYPGYR